MSVLPSFTKTQHLIHARSCTFLPSQTQAPLQTACGTSNQSTLDAPFYRSTHPFTPPAKVHPKPLLPISAIGHMLTFIISTKPFGHPRGPLQTPPSHLRSHPQLPHYPPTSLSPSTHATHLPPQAVPPPFPANIPKTKLQNQQLPRPYPPPPVPSCTFSGGLSFFRSCPRITAHCFSLLALQQHKDELQGCKRKG